MKEKLMPIAVMVIIIFNSKICPPFVDRDKTKEQKSARFTISVQAVVQKI